MEYSHLRSGFRSARWDFSIFLSALNLENPVRSDRLIPDNDGVLQHGNFP